MSRFSLTKRRVQGGEATSERRRRDGVSGKSHQRKAPRPPLQTTSHPVESAAESNARQVCTVDSKSKIFMFVTPQNYHHIARANKVCRKKRADSTGWVVPAESSAMLPTVG